MNFFSFGRTRSRPFSTCPEACWMQVKARRMCIQGLTLTQTKICKTPWTGNIATKRSLEKEETFFTSNKVKISQEKFENQSKGPRKCLEKRKKRRYVWRNGVFYTAVTTLTHRKWKTYISSRTIVDLWLVHKDLYSICVQSTGEWPDKPSDKVMLARYFMFLIFFLMALLGKMLVAFLYFKVSISIIRIELLI